MGVGILAKTDFCGGQLLELYQVETHFYMSVHNLIRGVIISNDLDGGNNWLSSSIFIYIYICIFMSVVVSVANYL